MTKDVAHACSCAISDKEPPTAGKHQLATAEGRGASGPKPTGQGQVGSVAGAVGLLDQWNLPAVGKTLQGPEIDFLKIELEFAERMAQECNALYAEFLVLCEGS